MLSAGRDILLTQIYRHLELDLLDGKKISGNVKEYLRDSPIFSFLLEKPEPDLNQETIKLRAGQVAWHLLITEGWGSRWWGPRRTVPKNRKLFWPESSTA
jgi:hypothetical protein